MNSVAPMIALHGVRKLYPPDQVALNGIDVVVEPGEFLFVAGASGAGKSTLLKLLYGAERASSGQVVVAGRNLAVSSESVVPALRRDIGIVFQDYKLLPRRTVIDNVAFGLEVQGVALNERRALAARLLEAIGLGDRSMAFPQMLSGGEQQRVALARALIHRPKIVLADEPTGNLDQNMSNVVINLLLEANMLGVTVIVATHNLALIEELNQRTIVLDRGKIIGDFDSPRGI
jgi:cell division transport system ATP-binding protein